MRHVLSGQIIEVGQVIEAQDTQWPGMAIRVTCVAGSKTVLIPLTWPEAKNLGASLYDDVIITIETAPSEGEPK